MKKGLTALLILILFMTPSAGVLAASGGEVYIEEFDMTVDLAQEWTVFTQETADDDEDVYDYGYESAQEVRDYCIENDVGILAYYGHYFYIVASRKDDFSEYIYSLADMDADILEDMKNAIETLGEYNKDNSEISQSEIYQNDNNAYIRLDIDNNSENIYCIIYITIIKGKYVENYLMSDKYFSDIEKKQFETMIDSITYGNDMYALADESTSGEEGELTNEDDGALTDHKNLTGKMAFIAAVCFAVIAGVIIFVMIKSKKKTKTEAMQQFAEIEKTFQDRMDEALNAPKPEKKEKAKQSMMICEYCKKAVPSESAVCPVCGEKLKKS
jgi:hypothetical protein